MPDAEWARSVEMYGPTARYKLDYKITNVRTASMYQASQVGRCAPGRHEYPRASQNSLPERPPKAELAPNSAIARGIAPL